MNVKIFSILSDSAPDLDGLEAGLFRGLNPGEMEAHGFVPPDGSDLVTALDAYTYALCFRQDKIDLPRETLAREVEARILDEAPDGIVSRSRRAEIQEAARFDLSTRALPRTKTVWATLCDSSLYVFTGSTSMAEALVTSFERTTGASTRPNGILERCFGRLEEALSIPPSSLLMPDTVRLSVDRRALANDAYEATKALQHLGPLAALWLMYQPNAAAAPLVEGFVKKVDFTGEVKSSMRCENPQFSPEALSAVAAGRLPSKVNMVLKTADTDMSWEVTVSTEGFTLEKLTPLLKSPPGQDEHPLELLLVDHLEVERVDNLLAQTFGHFLDRALTHQVIADVKVGIKRD